MSPPATILFLAANPAKTSRLRLDMESREVVAALRGARLRTTFHVEQRWAIDPTELRRALLDTRPRYVHFCGHGNRAGIALEGEAGKVALVGGAALAGLFRVFAGQVECVVLNACYSQAQATAINRHIRHVVGMKRAIGDRTAITFSTAFYDAIGAGRNVPDAFALGVNALHLENSSETSTPTLLTNPAIPSSMKTPSPARKRRSVRTKSTTAAPAPAPGIVINQSGSGAIAFDHGVAGGQGSVVIKSDVVMLGKKLRAATNALTPAARAQLARKGLKLIRTGRHE